MPLPPPRAALAAAECPDRYPRELHGFVLIIISVFGELCSVQLRDRRTFLYASFVPRDAVLLGQTGNWFRWSCRGSACWLCFRLIRATRFFDGVLEFGREMDFIVGLMKDMVNATVCRKRMEACTGPKRSMLVEFFLFVMISSSLHFRDFDARSVGTIKQFYN